MRLCILTDTLNPRTGMGILAGNIIDEIRRSKPNTELSVMTSEDYLKPNVYCILRNWSHIRSKIKGANIIHALDGYPYGIIACLANIGISKPVIITAVGSGSIRRLGGFGWKSVLLRWAYRRVTCITAISHYVAREIKKVLPGLTIEVINPGVDHVFYAGSDDRESTGVSVGEYIITQGEFKKRKGYFEMLPLIKKVMDVRPGIKYVIVAHIDRNKKYQNELYLFMDKLGIRNKVIVKSHLSREELRETYRNAILYSALPVNVAGDIEGFGMAIMEAAAAGTPAVVGKGSGADDAVLDGQSGFLVDGKNEKLVVEKILSVIDNKTLREKLSNGAKKWAKENGWEGKVKQYIALYEKILSQSLIKKIE